MSSTNDAPAAGDPSTVPHGIAGGSYDNLGRVAFGHDCPVLRCLCGWENLGGTARSWEEAGQLLDDHLEAVTDA